MLKIWRSACSRFGIYSESILRGIAEMGFNAIWIHGQLHHIIRHPRYPEFAPHGPEHIRAIKKLCARAERFGIKVFLYLQPPRAVPVNDTAFWNAHKEDGGQVIEFTGDDGRRFSMRSLCTSVPAVRQYIRESFADLTRQLPELGGLIIISASEYPAHCYSCRNCRPGPVRPRKLMIDHIPTSCPRCGSRQPEEVVLELIHTIRDGVRDVSSDLKLIFWNWSWSMYIDPPCTAILDRLPKDIVLMADFERGGCRKDGTFINEYSLGYCGPSEQFLDTKTAADRAGIPILPDTVTEIGRYAFMGCWNFGNLLYTSLKAFMDFLELTEDISCDEALRRFARKTYPGSDPGKITAAWYFFSEAMEQYPFSIPILYTGPQNHSLALIPGKGPLSGKKVGRSFLPDERGDSFIDSESKEFPLDEIIRRFGLMAEIWKKGTDLLLETLPADNLDLGNALICGAVWKSAFNMFRIYRLRKSWNDSMTGEWLGIIREELNVAESVLPYVENDPEQGWHIEGDFYSFNAEKIRKKISELKQILAADSVG